MRGGGENLSAVTLKREQVCCRSRSILPTDQPHGTGTAGALLPWVWRYPALLLLLDLPRHSTELYESATEGQSKPQNARTPLAE